MSVKQKHEAPTSTNGERKAGKPKGTEDTQENSEKDPTRKKDPLGEQENKTLNETAGEGRGQKLNQRMRRTKT